jgi:hypothetical protein
MVAFGYTSRLSRPICFGFFLRLTSVTVEKSLQISQIGWTKIIAVKIGIIPLREFCTIE